MSTENASNTRATRATRGQKLLLLASLFTMVFLATGQKEPEYDEDCCAVAEIFGLDEDEIIFVLQILAGLKPDRVIITPPSATLKPGGHKDDFQVKLASGREARFRVPFLQQQGIYRKSAVVDQDLTEEAALDVFLKPTSELSPFIKDIIYFRIAGRVFRRATWKEDSLAPVLLKRGERVSFVRSDDSTVTVKVIASRDTDPDEIYTDRVSPANALIHVDIQQVLADLGLTGN